MSPYSVVANVLDIDSGHSTVFTSESYHWEKF